MSESTMRGKVVKALVNLDAVAVENPAHPGTPDVNYIDGWIELKWARSWPKGAEAPLRVEHFTAQQRVWLRRRIRRGGQAWVLLKVSNEWLLIRGDVAADCLGSCTREQLLKRSVAHWRAGLNETELIQWLTQSNSRRANA